MKVIKNKTNTIIDEKTLRRCICTTLFINYYIHCCHYICIIYKLMGIKCINLGNIYKATYLATFIKIAHVKGYFKSNDRKIKWVFWNVSVLVENEI